MVLAGMVGFDFASVQDRTGRNTLVLFGNPSEEMDVVEVNGDAIR